MTASAPGYMSSTVTGVVATPLSTPLSVAVTVMVNVLRPVPEASSSYLIPSRIGWSRAYQMFTLGEPIPAKTCVEWGLAHVCVPRAKLRETALALAKKLADKPLGSLCATKRLMRETEAVKAASERERGVFEQRLLSKEAGEHLDALKQRRTRR